MRVKFSTTVYIQATASQMDMVFDTINTWANGNENLCTTIEDIEDVAANEDVNKATLFLSSVLDAINRKIANGGSVGDVIFHK